MAIVPDNIIKQVSRKNDSGYDTPFFIGSSAQYISGLRGSNSNNIEENMLIGFDTIVTERQLNERVLQILEEYRTEERTSEYYYVDTYIYSDPIAGNHYFSKNALCIPKRDDDNIFQDNTLIGIDTDIYYFLEDGVFNVVNEKQEKGPDIESTLYFVNEEETVIPVAKKFYYNVFDESTGTKIQKQIIKNLLV